MASAKATDEGEIGSVTWKWITGVLATLAMGLFAWSATMALSTYQDTLRETRGDVVENRKAGQENAKNIAEMRGDVKAIRDTVTDIRDELRGKRP